MSHHPDEFITVPEPPKPTIGFRRCGSFMRGAAIGAVSVVATVAIGGGNTDFRFSPAAECFPHQTPEQVQAVVREIAALLRAESEIRLRLLRAGVVVPHDQESFR